MDEDANPQIGADAVVDRERHHHSARRYHGPPRHIHRSLPLRPPGLCDLLPIIIRHGAQGKPVRLEYDVDRFDKWSVVAFAVNWSRSKSQISIDQEVKRRSSRCRSCSADDHGFPSVRLGFALNRPTRSLESASRSRNCGSRTLAISISSCSGACHPSIRYGRNVTLNLHLTSAFGRASSDRMQDTP